MINLCTIELVDAVVSHKDQTAAFDLFLRVTARRQIATFRETL
ncbi:hypothetical protein PJE062_213 [Pseudovibrio sp. JE062]|nr:hypothetical protein PJE062_213 [Pseudovibrio sp. JE062]